ncbi:MAG: hypothetical protein AMK69_26135 [Nitrospira bacterium SG8_3]|nr:MAG: hypothetical protein AMK69_26135 [Nitrospira bacterium SG8_3]
MPERQKAHRFQVLFLRASFVLCCCLSASTSSASDTQPNGSLTTKNDTPSPLIENLAFLRSLHVNGTTRSLCNGRPTQKARNDSRKAVYSNLVGMDIWCVSHNAKDPEVIQGLVSYIAKDRPREFSIQIDFAYFPASFPQKKGPSGLDSILDSEPFLGENPDLCLEDVDPEDGYIGTSLLVYCPSLSGAFLPYLWVRGVCKPLLSNNTSGVDVNCAASVQAGLPFRPSPHCTIYLEGGFILGLDENTSEPVQVSGLGFSLQWAF